jgi:hypothetical protein
VADVLLIHTINFPRLAIAPAQQDTAWVVCSPLLGGMSSSHGLRRDDDRDECCETTLSTTTVEPTAAA